MAVGGALRHVHVERLLHLHLPVHHAVAAAHVARLLHLLDHRPHPDRLDPRAAAAARAALLDALLLVDRLPRQPQRARRALVDLLERDLERVHHVLALLHALRPPRAPPPREHVEDVAGAAAAAAVLQPLLAVPVVRLALLLVAEDVEGLLDVLELLGVAALVRVVLHRELAVRLADLVGRRPLLDAEVLVQLRRVGRLAAAAAPAHPGHAAHPRHPAHPGHRVLEARREAAEKHGAVLFTPLGAQFCGAATRGSVVCKKRAARRGGPGVLSGGRWAQRCPRRGGSALRAWPRLEESRTRRVLVTAVRY